MRSPLAHLKYKGFYAVVLEKGDQLIAVASIRLHGTTVAEMPFIATCRTHRRQGMCRRPLSAKEKISIRFKVKKLALSAIASLVETWTSGLGFKRIEHDEMQKLAPVNLMVFPESVLLEKKLLVESAKASEKGTSRGGLYEEQAKKSPSLIVEGEVNEFRL